MLENRLNSVHLLSLLADSRGGREAYLGSTAQEAQVSPEKGNMNPAGARLTELAATTTETVLRVLQELTMGHLFACITQCLLT